ncbi:MAG: VOC family protein [Spongiibacteraceae bacterium]|nr:VOC family protein [Spongiibacteraceae bacterium]
MALHGTINHIALTVSDLDDALKFFKPFLEAFGYTVSEPSLYNETRLCVNVNMSNAIAINIWEAKQQHQFKVYEPGLHHLALNAGSKEQVDEIHHLVKSLGAEILDGPDEFPFAHDGYYALYFLGPDKIKFEVVYMPELDQALKRGKQKVLTNT